MRPCGTHCDRKLAVEVWQCPLRSRVGEEMARRKKRRRTRRRRRRRRRADIKSNNAHLAGRELLKPCWELASKKIRCVFPSFPPPLTWRVSRHPIIAMLLAMSSTVAMSGPRQKEFPANDHCRIEVRIKLPIGGGNSWPWLQNLTGNKISINGSAQIETSKLRLVVEKQWCILGSLQRPNGPAETIPQSSINLTLGFDQDSHIVQ